MLFYSIAPDKLQPSNPEEFEVILPKPNQFFIDIDDEKQRETVEYRLQELSKEYELTYTTSISKSGLPHQHIIVSFDREFTQIERLLWQAALGDDPKRVLVSFCHMLNGEENVTRFFEKKKKSLDKLTK